MARGEGPSGGLEEGFEPDVDVASLNSGFHTAFVAAAVIAGAGALITIGWLRGLAQSVEEATAELAERASRATRIFCACIPYPPGV